jgi:hypothetical protein
MLLSAGTACKGEGALQGAGKIPKGEANKREVSKRGEGGFAGAGRIHKRDPYAFIGPQFVTVVSNKLPKNYCCMLLNFCS